MHRFDNLIQVLEGKKKLDLYMPLVAMALSTKFDKDVLSESNGSDKGLYDWILDKELMNPMAYLVAVEGNSGEKLLATRSKERGGK